MDQYTELLARRELMFAEWMRWVDAEKAVGTQAKDFNSAGVTFERSGTLRMQAHNARRAPMLELECSPGETIVRVTFADPSLALA